MVLIKKLFQFRVFIAAEVLFLTCPPPRALSIYQYLFFLSIHFLNVHFVLPVDWNFSQELFLPKNTSIILIESALD